MSGPAGASPEMWLCVTRPRGSSSLHHVRDPPREGRARPLVRSGPCTQILTLEACGGGAPSYRGLGAPAGAAALSGALSWPEAGSPAAARWVEGHLGQQHYRGPLAEVLPEARGRASFGSLGSSLHLFCLKLWGPEKRRPEPGWGLRRGRRAGLSCGSGW